MDAVTFLEVIPAALTGQPVRGVDWIKGLFLRWNWNKVQWEWTEHMTGPNLPPHEQWEWHPVPSCNGMLSPLTMLAQWEVYPS